MRFIQASDLETRAIVWGVLRNDDSQVGHAGLGLFTADSAFWAAELREQAHRQQPQPHRCPVSGWVSQQG
jgi:hypothetical protein